MKELLTEAMVLRNERNERICDEYKTLRNKFPKSSDNLIFTEIARNYKINKITVRGICLKAGVCTSASSC